MEVNDPKIPGTRVPIYRISALADGGHDTEYILYEFPSLTSEQVAYAITFAEANPPPESLKYPKEGFKHFLCNSGFSMLATT